MTLKSPTLALMMASASLFAADACGTPTRAQSAAHQADANINDLRTLETAIVGLHLEGETWLENIEISDLDILWTDDNRRWLPLLRLCREFEIVCREDSGSLSIGDTLTIALASGRIQIGDESRTSSTRIGISDLTWERDVWLPDSIAAECLGLTIFWEENLFAYRVESDRVVPKLARMRAERKQRRVRPAQTREVVDQTSSLPEMFPPAEPREFRQNAVGTIRPGIRFSTSTAGNFTMQRSLESWGRLVRGEYAVRLRQSDPQWESYTRLDEAYWYGRVHGLDVDLGDIVFGLNDLILPAAPMTGFQINGVLGEQKKRTPGFRPRSSGSFGSRQDFRGFAPVGSTVRIYNNDRLLGEQVVEGDGTSLESAPYHFRGVNLLRGATNQVRIVVTEPDSSVHEETREIMGSDALLASGKVALTAAAGTRRLPDEDFWYTQGQIAAARTLIGLPAGMTLGATAVHQKDHSFSFPIALLDDENQSYRVRFPRESLHGGAEWACRLLDRNVLSATGAYSEAKTDSIARFAVRAGLVSAYGPLTLHPQWFRYEPEYFNGVDRWLEDREGYSTSVLVQLARPTRVIASVGKVQDNLDGTEPDGTTLHWQRLTFMTSALWKGTELSLSGDRLEPRGMDDSYVWTVDSRCMLPFETRWSGLFIWGDEYFDVEGWSLMDNLDIPHMPRGRRNGWESTLDHRIFGRGTIALTHSEFPNRERTYLTQTFRTRGKLNLYWKLQGGYDWKPDAPFGESMLSYRLDGSGTGTLNLMSRYQRREWTFGISLSLRPTLALRHGRPHLLTRSTLDPRFGGLEGSVFLDKNANGHREPGEPGIRNMEILTDRGQRIAASDRGTFTLRPRGKKQTVHISLNPAKIPAFYEPIHGAQWADIEEGALTEVDLGLVILSSISGSVYEPDPEHPDQRRGMRGLRVQARNSEGEISKESVTASDGSFYIGELLPGEYQLEIDDSTLPESYVIAESPELLVLQPTDMPVDIDGVVFHCRPDAGINR